MTPYQIISALNSGGLAYVVVRLTLFIKDYNMVPVWAPFFFIYYAALWFTLANQLFTLFTPASYGWLLKVGSTFMWVAAIYFHKAIKTTSVLK